MYSHKFECSIKNINNLGFPEIVFVTNQAVTYIILLDLPQKLIDQHTRKNAHQDANDRKSKKCSKTAVEDAMDDFAIGRSSKNESHCG